MQSTHTLTRWCTALLLSAVFTFGCERKPEDLDQWRNAEGGMEKLQEWASSKKESDAVRARAVQILIEENHSNDIPALIDKVKEDSAKTAIVKASVETIEKLWSTQDQPVLTEEMKTKGVAMKVGASKAVQGVEAAYYMHPYATGEDQKKLENILGDWLSKDHELRRQLSTRITLEQILPRAGDKGFDGIMLWFAEHKNPGTLASAIEQYGDDKTKDRFIKTVVERATKEHPNTDPQIRVIIERSTNEAVVPYLIKAIDDPASPGPLADAMMDTYIRIKGPAATSKLNELVTKRKDIMRSVAFTRLIELRGEAGVTQAANALPLEIEGYATEGENTLEKDAAYLCNIIKTELKTTHKVDDPKPVIEKMLKSSRWPAQAIAIHCAEKFKWSDWKPAIMEMTDNGQVVPGWGEEGTTLGTIASLAAQKL